MDPNALLTNFKIRWLNFIAEIKKEKYYGEAEIKKAAVSYNNIFIFRQFMPAKATLTLLEELADMMEIIEVTATVIRESLERDFKDYEDAIQYQSALSIPDLNFIVTRHTKDFKKSTLAVLTPTEALASFSIV